MIFKHGDRVVILSKSYWGSLDSSNIYKKGKKRGYWYFVEYVEKYIGTKDKVCVVDWQRSTNDGDYFIESDLELYIDNIMDELKFDEFKL